VLDGCQGVPDGPRRAAPPRSGHRCSAQRRHDLSRGDPRTEGRYRNRPGAPTQGDLL